MADNKDMKLEYDMFADVWKLFKKYYDMDNTESNWDDAMEVVHVIGNKYNSKLCNDLLISVVMELERRKTDKAEDM